MPIVSSPLGFGLDNGLPPWIVPLAQSDFLALVERLLPEDYLQPLKSPGPGYEIYMAHAAIGARVSLAIANYQAASYITTAPDGGYAEAPVLFSRPTADAGAVTVKAGTIVKTSVYGRSFALLADVTFGDTDLEQPGIVRALYQGEQWNVPGPYTTASGEIVPGSIDTIVTWLLDPPFGDATLTVSQTSDAVGGISSVLNQHGADRGMPRNPGEAASAYRVRIRTLPDTVSPLAIQRYLQSVFSPFNESADFIESFDPNYQTAYDCPSPNAGTPTYSASIPASLNTNLFVYDDPSPLYPFRNRWLGNDWRGGFIVVVPNIPAVSDVGMAYDDIADTPAELNTTAGWRSVSAYDIPNTFTAASPGGYDGFDLGKQALYRGVYATLQQIKAGGIIASVELQGQ